MEGTKKRAAEALLNKVSLQFDVTTLRRTKNSGDWEVDSLDRICPIKE